MEEHCFSSAPVVDLKVIESDDRQVWALLIADPSSFLKIQIMYTTLAAMTPCLCYIGQCHPFL